MKKTVLLGIVTLVFVAVSNSAAWAEIEFAAPNIPSDFLDTAKWSATHTESCMPHGKKYRSTMYGRIITDDYYKDRKIEYLLTTSLNGVIFRYEYSWNGGQPFIGTVFIKTEAGWSRFNKTENFAERFKEYMTKNGVSEKDYYDACHKTIASGFDEFGSELLKKLYEK